MFALIDTKSTVTQIEAVIFPVHEDLVWVDITGVTPTPEVGWNYDGADFTAPLPPVRPPKSAAPLSAEEIATLMVDKGLASRSEFDAIKTDR